MEQKTNTAGEQTGTGQERSPWLEKVSKIMDKEVAQELDACKNPHRGFLLVAVDGTTQQNPGVLLGIVGGARPLAYAVATLLTSPNLSQHIANAARLMAANPDASVKIKLDSRDKKDNNQPNLKPQNEQQ